MLEESKFVHFSDWPLPKPWLKATEKQSTGQQPPCSAVSEGELDCTDRDVWLKLRKDFSERRLVCYDLPSRRTTLATRSAFVDKLTTTQFCTPIPVQMAVDVLKVFELAVVPTGQGPLAARAFDPMKLFKFFRSDPYITNSCII